MKEAIAIPERRHQEEWDRSLLHRDGAPGRACHDLWRSAENIGRLTAPAPETNDLERPRWPSMRVGTGCEVGLRGARFHVQGPQRSQIAPQLWVTAPMATTHQIKTT